MAGVSDERKEAIWQSAQQKAVRGIPLTRILHTQPLTLSHPHTDISSHPHPSHPPFSHNTPSPFTPSPDIIPMHPHTHPHTLTPSTLTPIHPPFSRYHYTLTLSHPSTNTHTPHILTGHGSPARSEAPPGGRSGCLSFDLLPGQRGCRNAGGVHSPHPRWVPEAQPTLQ